MAPHFKNDSSIYHELMHLSELIPTIYSLLLSKLSITQARLLGGFKQRESIVREIQGDTVKWLIGGDGNYMIKGQDYISILKDRNRWYWTDNVRRTKDRNRIS